MTKTRMFWGPAEEIRDVAWALNTSPTPYALDDADDKVAQLFIFKAGTISKLGFAVTAEAGTPPDYYVGLFTVDASGNPSSTSFGGSSIETYTHSGGVGWKWLTLGTPATAVNGDRAYLVVYPTSTAPDSSNRISSTKYCFFEASHGLNAKNFSTGWTAETGQSHFAVEYSDGSIVGFYAALTYPNDLIKTSTIVESGGKFVAPANFTCLGVTPATYLASASASHKMVLYNSASVEIATTVSYADLDYYGAYSAAGKQLDNFWITPVELIAGETYRVVCQATSTNTITICYATPLSAEGEKALFLSGSKGWTRTYRETVGGAWTDVPEDVPPWKLLVEYDFAAVGGSSGGQFAFVG